MLNLCVTTTHENFLKESLQNIRSPKKVFIDRIPKKINKDFLMGFFSKFGEIEHLNLVDRDDKTVNFAYITFYDSSSATEVVNDGNLCIIGRKKKVKASYARPKFSGNMLNKLTKELKDYVLALQEKKIEYDEQMFTELESQFLDYLAKNPDNLEKNLESFEGPSFEKKGKPIGEGKKSKTRNPKSTQQVKNKLNHQQESNLDSSHMKELYLDKNAVLLDHVRKSKTVSFSDSDSCKKNTKLSSESSDRNENTDGLIGKNTQMQNLIYNDQKKGLKGQINMTQTNQGLNHYHEPKSNFGNQFYNENYEYDYYQGSCFYLNQNDSFQTNNSNNFVTNYSCNYQTCYNTNQQTQNFNNNYHNVQQSYVNAPYSSLSYQDDQYNVNSVGQNQIYNNEFNEKKFYYYEFQNNVEFSNAQSFGYGQEYAKYELNKSSGSSSNRDSHYDNYSSQKWYYQNDYQPIISNSKGNEHYTVLNNNSNNYNFGEDSNQFTNL